MKTNADIYNLNQNISVFPNVLKASFTELKCSSYIRHYLYLRYWRASIYQWTEYNWNARWGEKFEAIRTQTFHATNHATKTNDYAISINNVCKIVKAIKSEAKNIVFTFTKNIYRVDYIALCSDIARYDAGHE